MKFGRSLTRNTVPEWTSSYINYKGLKKLIKASIEAKKRGEEPNLPGFFYSLDRNLEDVEDFYSRRFADFSRQLKLLEERYGHSLTNHRPQADDVEDLLAALLELRGQFRKLQWYGEVNRRGFLKITKKLDKKLPGSNSQAGYVAAKVDPAQFASNTRLAECLKQINDWLSALGDNKVLEDANYTNSLSINAVPSRATLKIPQSLLLGIDDALRQDDSLLLQNLLPELKTATDNAQGLSSSKALKALLQRAIHYKAKASIVYLLDKVDDLIEDDDINMRNCIHRLVISIGRSQSTDDSDIPQTSVLDFPDDRLNYITPATEPGLQQSVPKVKGSNQQNTLNIDNLAVSLLQHLLDSLRPHQRPALLAKDASGRTPLHYGAKYGFRIVCEIIIKHLKAWDLFDVKQGIDGENWQDNEGWAPLHLSVMGGFPLTTRALLDSENPKCDTGTSGRTRVSKSGAALALATKSNFVNIVKLLVSAGIDINYQDDQGETALHVAARFGHDECAKVLIEGTTDQKANIELEESTYSWTPLFIACVDGNMGVTELLIQAGADIERLDSSGWTAIEHAALRGHYTIAERLSKFMSPKALNGAESKTSLPATSNLGQSSLSDRKSNDRATEPVKTFGHRYLKDESMVLVSLGSLDPRKSFSVVNLEQIPLASAHLTQLDTPLSIVVSASGASGEPEIIDLPIHENMSTEPIVFRTKDASKVQIKFDLIPTYSGSKDKVVGRGVALLSSIKPTVGSKRITLQGDLTVPILAANTLDVIGSVTFNFLIITPFTHPNMTITEGHTYWKSTSPMVIGHRGLGKNEASRRSLQLGENTVQSFIAAASLGASYVEFDVQLTKDHVPVIYHDFLVSETGIDAPVHALTLEQFLHLSESRRARDKIPSYASAIDLDDDSPARANGSSRQRSMSVGGDTVSEVKNERLKKNERMKHTRDFKRKGFKGNTRGEHIQAPFATLEELFKKLPESVGFNIELKYPMLFETELEEMDTYAVELNSFVDTVLAKVYDLGGDRNMIFSSFNPDICILLSSKQPSIPVLFLSDAGVEPVGDIRASSLQEAIRFASRWNLLGVVAAVQPMILCPRLVRVVKESGLVCVSYGVANNDPENVKLQVNEGIDAVIVDNVLAIRQGLTQEENKASALPSPSPSPAVQAPAQAQAT